MNFNLKRKNDTSTSAKKHNNCDKYNSHDKAFINMSEYSRYSKNNPFNGNRHKSNFGGFEGQSERE